MAYFRNCIDTALLQAEGGLIAFAESFADPIMIVSPQGTIGYCNKSLLCQLGYTNAELLGKPFDHLFLHFDVDCCTAISNKNPANKDGRYTLIINGVVTHKNRSPLAAELTIFPFHIGKSPMAAVVCRLKERTNTMEYIDFNADYHNSSNMRPPKLSPDHKMIGTSSSIGRIREMTALVGKTDSSVLVTGESGTGKELVAEALHAASRRSDHPLVKLNCAALPETLLESELFGFMKGSFTGAVHDSCGLFKATDGGTLFLDEIGEISPAGQSKLLHVLETQEFHRIGESTPIKIDVRIIAATNQDLPDRIQKGLFREDLYYRLNVIEINVPPLRERTEDIPALIEHFLKRLNWKLKKSIQVVSDDVLKFFEAHTWPGNVRELAHALEHACVLCQNKIIHRHHLPPELQKSSFGSERLPTQREIQSAEMIQNILIKSGGNKALAARMLGINRKTLYRKIKKYHITSGR